MGKNADAVKKGVEMFNQKKMKEVMDLYDDTAVIESQGTVLGGAFKGKKAIADYFQKLGSTFPGGVRLRIENLHEAGDTVVAEWKTTGKLANGKDFEDRAAHVFDFRGGKVIRHRQYTNTENLARAMGKL